MFPSSYLKNLRVNILMLLQLPKVLIPHSFPPFWIISVKLEVVLTVLSFNILLLTNV